jgi:two-component system sensor histidine kinase UhpB
MFATLQERTAAAATAVRNLSHDLHPGVLKHAGLTATLRSHCADIERHHQVTVTFNPGDGLDSLDSDVALCLFRVVQEALTNVLRHARARTICVSLGRPPRPSAAERRRRRIVAASARGPDQAAQHSERVRFLHGHVSVVSRPGGRTKVLVQIPIGERRRAIRAPIAYLTL